MFQIQPVGAGDNSAICLGDCTLEDAYSVLQKQTERVQMFFWSGGESRSCSSVYSNSIYDTKL